MKIVITAFFHLKVTHTHTVKLKQHLYKIPGYLKVCAWVCVYQCVLGEEITLYYLNYNPSSLVNFPGVHRNSLGFP